MCGYMSVAEDGRTCLYTLSSEWYQKQAEKNSGNFKVVTSV